MWVTFDTKEVSNWKAIAELLLASSVNLNHVLCILYNVLYNV